MIIKKIDPKPLPLPPPTYNLLGVSQEELNQLYTAMSKQSFGYDLFKQLQETGAVYVKG